jgi:4-hydroxy-tetrahydrodipicolinate synthase
MMGLASGILVPSVTVFRDDASQSIDEAATAEHIDWLIRNGADAIVPAGSSGEFPALSADEAKGLFELALSAAAGRVPVYPAAGRYATRDTIELCRFAEKVGAPGVMVIVPYYLLPDPPAVMEHFRAVRRATDLPIILYNNPKTVGVEVATADIVTLAQEGVVQGVKSSQGDVGATLELKRAHPALRSYYGHDFVPASALLEGADGWFSLFPNVFPRLAKELWQAAVARDQARAHSIQERLSPCIDFVWRSGAHPLAAVKAALAMQGRTIGEPRRPLLPLGLAQQRVLEPLVRRALEGTGA